MVGLGVIKIHRPFDEAQTQDFGVKVKVAFGISGYSRNVVDALNPIVVIHIVSFFDSTKFAWWKLPGIELGQEIDQWRRPVPVA
jgi:hypothetical protein